MAHNLSDCEVILGNSNPRFSGVTSTMLQTLTHQRQHMPICVLGKHHLPKEFASHGISFWQAVKHLRAPLPNGKARVFHARRNDEMIQALLLKHVFKLPLSIVFTSTAQRRHSGLTRWLMKQMDAILSTGKAAAQYLQQAPLALIPHGIQSDTFYPYPSYPANTEQTQNIAIFGRVREQKGTHLFVEAAIDILPRFPKAKAFIIGAITPEEHAFANALKAKIKEAGLGHRIQFLGEQPFDKLPELFRSMDIITALSRTEGYGLTVLEAMSSGAAVIATEAGAWPEIIEQGEQGWVIPVGDKQALVHKLDTLLSDPEQMQMMGRKGRERILAHYRIEDEARKLCDIYRQLQYQS